MCGIVNKFHSFIIWRTLITTSNNFILLYIVLKYLVICRIFWTFWNAYNLRNSPGGLGTNREISAVEVVQAIKSMQSNKAPWWHQMVFQLNYIKNLQPNWHQYLNCCIWTFFNQIELSQTMPRAIKSLLLEKDKEQLHPEQTGFIPCSLFTTCAASLMYCTHYIQQNKKFGFGPSFFSWIKVSYHSPTAAVHINNAMSDYFHLHRGCRQDCSFSPYLFDLVIEPLVIAPGAEDDVSVFSRGDKCRKVSLYADNLLLNMSEPRESMPKLLLIVDNFGHLSGYKITYSKSLLFPVNKTDSNYSSSQFTLEKNVFTYMGIKVTYLMGMLYPHNFKTLLEQTKQDFRRWSALLISFVGQISIVKMTKNNWWAAWDQQNSQKYWSTWITF